jgi:hypothetical protein
MNRLKTKGRARMSGGLLNDMMFTKLHAPNDMKDWNPHLAISLFKHRQKRKVKFEPSLPYKCTCEKSKQ